MSESTPQDQSMEGPTIEEYSVSQVPLQSLPDDSQTEAAPLSLPETPAPVNAVQPLLSEAESEESEEGDGHEETVEKDFLDHELDRQRAEEELKHRKPSAAISLKSQEAVAALSQALQQQAAESGGELAPVLSGSTIMVISDAETHADSGLVKELEELKSKGGIAVAVDEETQRFAEKLKALEDAFDVFDVDHGGSIEREEIKDIVGLVGLPDNDENIDKISAALGAVDGVIERTAFVTALIPFAKGDGSNPDLNMIYKSIDRGDVLKLRKAFDACDADHSNEIDATEFSQVMKSLGEDLKDEEVNAMFRELDTSGDGKVSFQEFIRYMCRRKDVHVKGGMKYFNIDALNSISSFLGDKKVSEEEQKQAIADMPLLERLGVRYVKTTYRRKEVKKNKKITKGANEVHILSDEERGKLKKIECKALSFDFTIGAVCAGLAAIAEVLAHNAYSTDGTADELENPNDPDEQSFTRRLVNYWLIVGIVSIVAAIFEIILIYIVHIKAAINISRVTGLRLFPVDKERAFITAGLARAALELPHPKGEDLGVDPLEEASKTRLALAAVVYKAKTGLATFVLRLLVKRVASRAAVRGLDAFAAIPVSIFFDVMIGYKCLRQSRIVALGPSIAVEVLNCLLDPRGKMEKPVRVSIMRAVACAIVGNEEMHPNLRILLNQASFKLDLAVSNNIVTEEEKASLVEKGQQERTASDENVAESSQIMSQSFVSETSQLQADEHKASSPDPPHTVLGHAELVAVDEKKDVELTAVVVHTPSANSQNLLKPSESGSSGALVPSPVAAKKSKKKKHAPKGKDQIERPGKPSYFLEGLATLEVVDQRLSIQVLTLALILDGNVSGKLVKLFKKACDVCGLAADEWVLRYLVQEFIAGRLRHEDIQEMFEPEFLSRVKPSGYKAKCTYICDKVGNCLAC